MQRSILDTGPVVALFDKSDYFHKKIFDFFSKNNFILYITWPVITEISYLLDFNKKTQIDFLKWLEPGALHVVDFDIADLSILSEYMNKYKDVPMDLADASLMLISDKLDLRKIITLDKDFYVYRKQDGKYLLNLISNLLPQR